MNLISVFSIFSSTSNPQNQIKLKALESRQSMICITNDLAILPEKKEIDDDKELEINSMKNI